MNASKKYILTLLFFSFAIFANAQTNGCYVSGTGRMYSQTPTPGNPTTYFEGAAYDTNYAACTPGGYFFSLVTTTNTNCKAIYDGSGSKTSGSNYTISGKKATFHLIACPIDSYTMLLMGLTACFGVFFLRRMNFTASA